MTTLPVYPFWWMFPWQPWLFLMKHESSRGLKRRDNMATGIWKFLELCVSSCVYSCVSSYVCVSWRGIIFNQSDGQSEFEAGQSEVGPELLRLSYFTAVWLPASVNLSWKNKKKKRFGIYTSCDKWKPQMKKHGLPKEKEQSEYLEERQIWHASDLQSSVVDLSCAYFQYS